jgi:hypothetical protein
MESPEYLTGRFSPETLPLTIPVLLSHSKSVQASSIVSVRSSIVIEKSFSIVPLLESTNGAARSPGFSPPQYSNLPSASFSASFAISAKPLASFHSKEFSKALYAYTRFPLTLYVCSFLSGLVPTPVSVEVVLYIFTTTSDCQDLIFVIYFSLSVKYTMGSDFISGSTPVPSI